MSDTARVLISVEVSWAGDDWRSYSEFMEDLRYDVEEAVRQMCDEQEPYGVAKLVRCEASG